MTQIKQTLHMKKFTLFFITVISMTISNAQNLTDALRYSTQTLNGTARFNAMSGAFGALGGDVSSLEINPAATGVMIRSVGTGTFSVVDNKNKASYFGTNTEESYAKLNFNQAGFVFVFNTPNENSKLNKFSIGFNYISSNNFDNDISIIGTGNNSIGDYFVAQANGVSLDLLQLQQGESISSLYQYLGENEGTSAQNAFLGYQGYVIDPLEEDPENTSYISNISDGNFNHAYFLSSDGYGAKYTFNMAVQLNHSISFGVNLTSNNFNYRQFTYLNESNNNNGSTVNYVGFENNLSSYGRGFSAQFGIIGKVTDAFRLGITYDTPIWYNIYDDTYQTLETEGVINDESFREYINPQIINIFYKYELRTPWKIAGSAAYVFGKKGLISVDYSYKDFSFTRFSPSSDPAFSYQNEKINNELNGASSIKVGGEYRIDILSLRGGYIFEESPYKNKETLGDLNGFSAGFGFYFGHYSVDMAYSRIEQRGNYQMYDVGFTDTASIKNIRNNYTMTFVYEMN